jgi:hypothetical protein
MVMHCGHIVAIRQPEQFLVDVATTDSTCPVIMPITRGSGSSWATDAGMSFGPAKRINRKHTVSH